MISHADWALFAKNGVDVITNALRIARAQTGRRRVLVATGSYHGAHAWCTPHTVGVLPEERAHRAEYRYNDIGSLEAAVAEAGDDLAAIFATAHKHDFNAPQDLPRPEYARRCREICDRTGALLVVDDVRSGFRLARDCSWELVGVRPDLSCWSKAIANGYPISALLGSERTRAGAGMPLITGTFWIQAVPMAAALETLEIVRTTPYLEHTIELGHQLRLGLDAAAAAHGFELNQTGPVQMPIVHFKEDPDFRLAMRFCSGMMQNGIYMIPQHNLFICAAMTKDDIEQTIEKADRVLSEMAKHRSQIEPHGPMLKAMGRPR
jgi:glutamate-1-semialdehyde 2,1-aminomutase